MLCWYNVKLMHRETPDFIPLDFWPPNNPDLTPEITTSYRLPCRSMFTRHTSLVLMNGNGSWFSSGAVLTKTY